MESISRSLEIIESRIAEKLTVEAIAQSVYFSKFHYQRLFREIVGESVMAYVMRRKHALAGEMLRETEVAVLDVALAFGFETHEGFTRSFKAHMGATPSNYRKKGGTKMKSKIMTVIERELGEFIMTARETAEAARQEAVNGHEYFLQKIAKETDALAERVAGVLARAESMAKNPDEITNRLTLATSIGDAAFNTNIFALHVALAMNRNAPTKARKNLCEKYYKLASIAVLKAEKAREFFAELAALILDDIRKTAAEKVAAAIKAGKTAAAAIEGYGNIKYETENLVRRLEELSLRDATVYHYDDALFQLDIILFTFELEMGGRHKESDTFRQILADAVEFFRLIPKPEPDPVARDTLVHRLNEVAFQGHILLFHTRGEAEKSGKPASDFEKIVDEINAYLQKIYDTDKINTFFKSPRDTAEKSPISEAIEHLHNAATALRIHGGAFTILAEEIELLAGRVRVAAEGACHI